MTSPWEEAAPPAERVLLGEHRAILTDESGIDGEIIDHRGYHSLTEAQVRQLVQLEVIQPSVLKATGWLSIPIIRPDAAVHGEIIRLFGAAPGVQKYLWPTGRRNAIDVHPDALVDLLDPAIPLIVTEGVKKADAIYSAARREGFRCVALALNGCWGWRTKITGGSVASPDFLDIPLEDRKVYVVPDSDYRTNDDVRRGWDGCAEYLEGKTGPHRVALVVVPPDGLDKQGADDYLASGQTLADLLGLATSTRYPLLAESSERRPLLVKSGKRVLAEAGDAIPHLLTPILPEKGILVIAGHSGTFKTWHALGLMLDGAFGLPWLDHPDFEMRGEPFATLYVNKEMGGVVLATRLKKLATNERYRGRADFDEVMQTRVFSTDEASLDLKLPDQRERLEESIRELRVQLVVLDSLSMVWTGDENSASEVGAFYAQLRSLTERTGASWGIIHHLLKPSTGKAKLPAKFSVRGSGQIVQQADAAIVFSAHNEDSGDPDVREIAIEPVKTRTDREPPAFVSRFLTNDGMFASLAYGGRLSEAAQRAYSASEDDPSKFAAWISTELAVMPAMSPGSSGLRTKQVAALLRAAWPSTDGPPPSERTITRHLSEMVESKTLELLDDSRRHGKLFRFRSDADPRSAPPGAAGADDRATT